MTVRVDGVKVKYLCLLVTYCTVLLISSCDSHYSNLKSGITNVRRPAAIISFHAEGLEKTSHCSVHPHRWLLERTL